jgi:uncharacterized cupredoxin-like copper-binding protein
VACGESTGTTPPGSKPVQVTISKHEITSSVTTFSPGTPYHFVVTNTGPDAYIFMLMPMRTNMAGLSIDDMHKIALHTIDAVAPGETKAFDYTFASSMKGPGVEFACHLPGHYTAGLKFPITVSE